MRDSFSFGTSGMRRRNENRSQKIIFRDRFSLEIARDVVKWGKIFRGLKLYNINAAYGTHPSPPPVGCRPRKSCHNVPSWCHVHTHTTKQTNGRNSTTIENPRFHGIVVVVISKLVTCTLVVVLLLFKDNYRRREEGVKRDAISLLLVVGLCCFVWS